MQLAILSNGAIGAGYNRRAVGSGTAPMTGRAELLVNGSRECQQLHAGRGTTTSGERRSVRPTIKSIQEFKMQTNCLARAGRNSGAR
jgi:hypothetical protein